MIPAILTRLARLLGTEIKNRQLDIPEQYGEGYCKGFVFNEHIRMLISNYRLNEDVIVENPEKDISRRILFFKFQHIFREPAARQPETAPSVLIATSRINTDEVISVHSNTATINIEVDAGYLSGLFDGPEKSTVLQSLLQNTQPLVFEQIVSPSLQKIADEIVTVPVGETFERYFMRIKAEELICRLLMELERREEKHLYALNSKDIRAIYRVKQSMLEYPDTPPVIHELAVQAGMSPTKLKRLFRQIFGDSIFHYYQAFRMQEAARLLKEKKLSVSEAGYRLGFSNLSHFSRVFEKHIGMKPKKYSVPALQLRD